nr:MAG TPA: hypothetical protein [Caudoviricetes sp.]
MIVSLIYCNTKIRSILDIYKYLITFLKYCIYAVISIVY